LASPPLDSSAAITVDLHISVHIFRSSDKVLLLLPLPDEEEEEEERFEDRVDLEDEVLPLLLFLPPTPVVTVTSKIFSVGRRIIPRRSKKYNK
jgi:hypothetical protein